MKTYSLALGIAAATVTLIALAIAFEVFYVRRRRAVRDLGNLIGQHMAAARSAYKEGGMMPMQLVENALNQGIHPTDENQAKDGLDVMLHVVEEAKRKDFLLPLAHKDVFKNVQKWAEKGSGPTSEVAIKLMPYLMERHVKHLEQITAQATTKISMDDPALALTAIRALTHQLDTATSAGFGIDPKMVLFSPNTQTLQKWASNEAFPATRDAAKDFLRSISDANLEFIANS